jgi:hypothetical protein
MPEMSLLCLIDFEVGKIAQMIWVIQIHGSRITEWAGIEVAPSGTKGGGGSTGASSVLMYVHPVVAWRQELALDPRHNVHGRFGEIFISR